MADFPLKTQNPITTSIDEQDRTAQSSVQWLLEKHPRSPVTQNNDLSFMICGKEGFESIAKDIKEAKQSIDIICWGFDPGMELERDDAKTEWPRGTYYGELLEDAATRGVKVRLLIWYNAIGSKKQNNLIGWTDDPLLGSTPKTYTSWKRHQYCHQWWKRNLNNTSAYGELHPNLRVVFRDVSKADATGLLKTTPQEEDSTAFVEGVLEEYFGTHHQKPILIDYDYDEGSHAVGYVMGLNSITDFWDTDKHEFDDHKRELWTSGHSNDEQAHEEATEGQKPKPTGYAHTKPYRDYACRITGPALAQLFLNFENAWNVKAGLSVPLPPSGGAHPQGLEARAAGTPASIPSGAPRVLKPASLLREPPVPPAKITKEGNQRPNPAYQVQIVRTQPHEKDKSIKELYFQSSSFARHYIYIENQYFFYPEFARHLKQTRLEFCKWWHQHKPLDQLPMLHMFVVIPHPEDDGMVPRTADTLTELGHSEDMPEQQQLGDRAELTQRYPDSHPVEITTSTDEAGNETKRKGYVLDRPSVQQLQKTLGLNISIARLRTTGPENKTKEAKPEEPKRAYREIYIHSKLMLIDDVFVTLGSANLNQRSMSIDSEINIGAVGPKWAKPLRERIFENLAGENMKWNGNFEDLPDAFRDWNKVMDDNKKLRKDGKPMVHFLLPFEDHRSTTTMHG